MSAGNKRGPIKVSGLVASGKVQVRDSVDGGDEPVASDTSVSSSVPENPPAENQTSSDQTPVASNSGLSLVIDTALDEPERPAPGGSSSGPSQAGIRVITTSVAPSAGGAVDHTSPALRPAAEAIMHAYPITQRISLALVDDSPYQPRKEYDPELIDALAMTMSTAGHAEPIRVRTKANGRYELISGHRRKRAALSLGWTEIEAFVEEKDDARAQIDTMLAAIGSHGLSDFELAEMLQDALNAKLATNQRQLAAWSGLNLSKVNGCLQMLQLPPSILEYLRRKPSLLGYETSRVILGLVKEYPNNLAEIERGVDRIAEGKPQNTLKGWVLQAIKGRPLGDPDRSLITSSGKLVFTTKRDASERAVVVNCKSPDIDMEAFEKKLQAWLEDQASSVASGHNSSDKATQGGST